MGRLWEKLTGALTGLGKRRRTGLPERSPPTFICSHPIAWESGWYRGEGELREISPTCVRLRLDRSLLVGRCIEISPRYEEGDECMSLDVVCGVVMQSRRRHGRVEARVQLLYPEQISRLAWLHLLRRECEGLPAPASPLSGKQPYRLHSVLSPAPCD